MAESLKKFLSEGSPGYYYRTAKRKGVLRALGITQDNTRGDQFVYPVPDHTRTTTEQMRNRLAEQAAPKRARASKTVPNRRTKSR